MSRLPVAPDGYLDRTRDIPRGLPTQHHGVAKWRGHDHLDIRPTRHLRVAWLECQWGERGTRPKPDRAGEPQPGVERRRGSDRDDPGKHDPDRHGRVPSPALPPTDFDTQRPGEATDRTTRVGDRERRRDVRRVAAGQRGRHPVGKLALELHDALDLPCPEPSSLLDGPGHVLLPDPLRARATRHEPDGGDREDERQVEEERTAGAR